VPLLEVLIACGGAIANLWHLILWFKRPLH